MNETTLWILPTPLGEKDEQFLPSKLSEIVLSLDGLIAESEKGARRFLSHFVKKEVLRNFPIYLLNEHTSKDSNQGDFLALLESKKNLALVSDTGMPCIADPGSELIFLARKKGVNIRVILGSCSIIMALILSGFDANRFYFHGYLPRKQEELNNALQKLEKQSTFDSATQIWIETPYRIKKMMQACTDCLNPKTHLCLARSLATSDEKILNLSIQQWRKRKINLLKEPAVFLLSTKKDWPQSL